MKETLLSMSIADNAAIMSSQQVSDFVFEKTGVIIEPEQIRDWRRGEGYPQDQVIQDALARTFGFKNYSYMLIPTPRRAMSVMIVAEDMGLSANMLRRIRLRKFTKVKLMIQMRSAIDITGDEQSAVGVAIAFWDNFLSKSYMKFVIKVVELTNRED